MCTSLFGPQANGFLVYNIRINTNKFQKLGKKWPLTWFIVLNANSIGFYVLSHYKGKSLSKKCIKVPILYNVSNLHMMPPFLKYHTTKYI